MNLKTYINDKFMMYCFESGFRTAVAKVNLELKQVKLDDFVYQDLTSDDPETLVQKNNRVLETHKTLSNRSIAQWYQVYQGKVSGYHAQNRFFNQIQESEIITQLQEQDFHIYFENFLHRTLNKAEKLLRSIDTKIDDLEGDTHIKATRDLVQMLEKWVEIGQDFVTIGIEDYGFEEQ